MEVPVGYGDEDGLRVGTSCLWAPHQNIWGTILGFSEAVILVGIGLKIDGMIANAHTARSVQSSVPAYGAVAELSSCHLSPSDYLLQ